MAFSVSIFCYPDAASLYFSFLALFRNRLTQASPSQLVDRAYRCLDETNYFETTKKLVKALYGSGDTMYWLGRSIYSEASPGVLHVRLIKDPELKVQELVKSHGMDSQSALDFIEREENDSRSYIRHYFEEDWANPALYDIVIDMGKVSPEDAISLIAEKWEEKQTGWRICRGPVRPP